MLEFNQALSTALGNATTKAAWSAAFIAGMGNTRRLICTKNGAAFIDVALVGSITTAGGNITGFGKASDAAVQLAADLSTGVCMLRIEGNGNYVQGTLGLPGSGTDFILPSNPTAASGVGFASGARINAPALLPSGTGPVAPDLDANAIVAFRLMDWRDPANVVPWGTAYFNVRDQDFVLEQPWMASEMGDVRVMRVADGAGVVMGVGGDCFRFAGDVLHMHAGANSEANVPVQQVEIRAMPHGRWASYPFKKDFNIASDTLAPPAHKIELLRADGSIADVIEMYSTRVNNVPGTGKPVNEAGQNQNWYIGQPLKPWWTCRMTHQWWSHKPKMHSRAWHFCPGVEADAMDPRNVASFASCSDVWPVMTENQTHNGMNKWRLAPKWSRGADTGLDTTIIDTYQQQPERDSYKTQAIGYGFEPGSTCTHVWYMAPGGPRADRAGWPTSVVAFMTNPEGIRIHGAVPLSEMFHHWMMGYFNHGCHFFTDVERGTPILKQKILSTNACFQDAYYRGGNEDYRPDIENNGINLFSATAGNGSGAVDKYGRRLGNEWARDLMHSQNNAACGAYLYRSPRHAIEAAHSFRASIMCTWDFNQTFSRPFFLQREHNWYNWNFANMWTCASSDPRSFSRSEIEAMWGQHLESVYDAVYPSYSTGSDTWGQMLRDLGMNFQIYTSGADTVYQAYDSKAFYFGQTFVLMKQSGSLEVMHARSAKCAAAIDMMVDCIAKSAANPFVQANGRGMDEYEHPKFSHPTNAPVVYTNWAQCWPVNGQVDWIRGVNGVIGSVGSWGTTGDDTNTKHFRAQTLKILKTYQLSSAPNIDLAIPIVDGFYNQIVAASGPSELLFKNRYPMMGFMKAPDYVGAPV